MWSWHPAEQYTVKSQCQLWYVMASFVSSSLRTGRLIFIWPLDSLWGHLEPPHLLDLDNTNEEVDAELWSLSNPWSGKGEGNRGAAAHNFHFHQPHCGAWPLSWYTGQGPCLGTFHCAATVGRLAGCRDRSWLLKLNGVDADGMEWGHPGPHGLMHPLVMASVINCWPLPRLTRLYWVGLAYQPN